MIRPLLTCSIIIHIGLLIWGFLPVGPNVAVPLVVLFGIVWIWSDIKQWPIPDYLILSTIYLVLLVAYLRQVDPIWTVSICLSGVVAWDLDRFQRYLLSVDRVISPHQLIRRHLLQLFGILCAGIAVIVLCFQVELQLNFYLVILLVIGILFSLKPLMK